MGEEGATAKEDSVLGLDSERLKETNFATAT